MIRRLGLILGGSLLIAAVGAALYFGVRGAYGAYGDYYYITAELDRAGQQVQVGTDVRVRGVVVGKISRIQLVDRHARLTLQIKDEYKIPRSAQGIVTLKTFLGSKFVDLRFDSDEEGPYLADGDSLASARVGPELEDALADGTKVLAALDPDDAAAIVHELAGAASGHGKVIARGLDANSDLSTLFADTTEPQLQVFRDFRVLFGELESKGVDMNALADAVNEGAPVYASAQAQRDMGRALEGLTAFADDFGDLLIFNRRDWDRMMDAGDVVLSTVAARPGGLRSMVHGLYRYVFKLGGDIGPNVLSDGSAAARFVNFIGGDDEDEEEKQICDALSEEEKKLVPACNEGKQ